MTGKVLIVTWDPGSSLGMSKEYGDINSKRV